MDNPVDMSCKLIKVGLTEMHYFRFEANMLRSEKDLLKELFQKIFITASVHPELVNKETAPVIEAIREMPLECEEDKMKIARNEVKNMLYVKTEAFFRINAMIEGLDRIFAELGIYEDDSKHFAKDDLLCLLRILVKLTDLMDIRNKDYLQNDPELSSLLDHFMKNVNRWI